MIEQFINFVIRPPRADYNPDQYLWEKDFTLAGRTYKRQDLELRNARGHVLRCSHYLPSPFPEDSALPCVIYCHGNSGCRADANEAAVILLPTNITVFTLDFSGSGLSDGEYVSLGWHERDDLKVVVSHLRSNKQISRIGLWGRSMGAVTSLLYGAEDPSIAGMVMDSAFSNLYHLMMELVDVYKIRLPKFTTNLIYLSSKSLVNMGRENSSGGGQSSLGYLFGNGEAPKPASNNAPTRPSEPLPVNNVPIPAPAPKPAASSPPIDVAKQIPAGIHSTSLNNYMRFDGQNTGNFITDRPSAKVHTTPSGGYSLGYLFGGPRKGN